MPSSTNPAVQRLQQELDQMQDRFDTLFKLMLNAAPPTVARTPSEDATLPVRREFLEPVAERLARIQNDPDRRRHDGLQFLDHVVGVPFDTGAHGNVRARGVDADARHSSR